MSALSHTPEPLRLKPSQVLQQTPAEYGGAGFRQATFAEVKDFFENPNASRVNALNPFLVMQANLYVTQVCLHTPLAVNPILNHTLSNLFDSSSTSTATS